jgi:DNA-binding NarL/FixJ family response regulator
VRAELGGHVDLVGEAGSVAEAVSGIARSQPDVVLLDVPGPAGRRRGNAAIARISTTAGRERRRPPLGIAGATEGATTELSRMVNVVMALRPGSA